MIKRWIKQWQEDRAWRAYVDGYDFAAGLLLRWHRDPLHALAHLRDREELGRMMGEAPHHFDDGMRDACERYSKITGIRLADER